MADDLKPNLGRVLSGKGKKFHFAYGAGKRKDGKGDGELIVRGGKPKKTEVQEELVNCKEVLEGVCWVGLGENKDTIYFMRGSGSLSGMVVAKMALAAKRATGRQFDFQVPSPEDVKNAGKLVVEDEDEEDEQETAKSKTGGKEKEKADNGKEKEKEKAGGGKEKGDNGKEKEKSDNGKEKTGGGGKEKEKEKAGGGKEKSEDDAGGNGKEQPEDDKAEKEKAAKARAAAAKAKAEEAKTKAIQERLKGYREKQREAIAKNPSAKAILGPLAQKAEGLMAKGDPGFLAALDEWEAGLYQVGALSSPQGDTERQALYEDRVEDLYDDLEDLIKSATPTGKLAQARFDEAQALSRKKEFKKALALLDRVEDLIEVGKAEAEEKAKAEQSEGGGGETGGGEGDQGGDGKPETEDDPAARKVETAYRKRLAGLLGNIKKAVAGGTDAGKEAKARYGEMQALVGKKDFEGATKLLDQVEELTKTALTPPPPSPEQEAFETRAASLVEGVKKALATGHAAGKEAKLRYSEAQVFARRKDFGQAMKLLTAVEKAVAEATKGGSGGPGGAPQLTAEEKALRTRFLAVGEDVKKAVATGKEAGKEAKLRFSEAQVFARKKDYEQARKLLDAVEAAVFKALTKTKADTEDEEEPEDAPEEAAEVEADTPDGGDEEEEEEDEADDDEDEEEEEADDEGDEEEEDGDDEPEVEGDEEEEEGDEEPDDEGDDEEGDEEPEDEGDEEEGDGDEEEDEEAETPQAEPQEVSREEKAVRTRIAAVGRDVKKAVATGKEAGKEAELRFGEAQVFARKKDFEQARKLLDAAEAAVFEALTKANDEDEEQPEDEEEEARVAEADTPDGGDEADDDEGDEEEEEDDDDEPEDEGDEERPEDEEEEARVADADTPDGGDEADDDEGDEDEEEDDGDEEPEDEGDEEEEDGDEEEGEETSQAAPQEVSREEKAVRTRIAAVGRDVKKAVATGKEAGKEAKLRFSEAQVFARKKDFEQARKLLDAAEAAVFAALTKRGTDEADETEEEASGETT